MGSLFTLQTFIMPIDPACSELENLGRFFHSPPCCGVSRISERRGTGEV